MRVLFSVAGKPLGELMKFKAAYSMGFGFLGSALVLGGITAAQQQNTGGQRRFPQPVPEKEVTVTAIPGLIGAGAKWKLVWQGPRQCRTIPLDE